VFLLVPAYLGCPGQKAVKRLCVCVCADVTSSSTHHGRHGILTTHRCRAGIPSDVPYTAFDIQKDDSHTERSGTYVCGSATTRRLSRSSTDLAKMPNARLESLGRNIFAI